MGDRLIEFTARAREYVLGEVCKRGSLGIRFSVVFGGCQGLTYSVDYIDEIDEVDISFEVDGIRVFIEPKAVLFLEGMLVDYEVGVISSGFRFSNPNAKKSCGCGLSFCTSGSGGGGSCNGRCS